FCNYRDGVVGPVSIRSLAAILGLFELCISPDGGGSSPRRCIFLVVLTVATVMTAPTILTAVTVPTVPS
ncbi:hypothetical protein, partial [Photobacterium sp. R1]